jgi:hypothetical protein
MADIMGGLGRAVGRTLRRRKKSGNIGKAGGRARRLVRGLSRLGRMVSRAASPRKKRTSK